jgi:hypothetical protein
VRALGRRLRPLLQPDWADERQLLGRLERLADRAAERQDRGDARIEAIESRLHHLDTLADARAVGRLSADVRELRRTVGSHLRTTTRALSAVELLDDQARLEQAIDRRVRRAISRGGALAGPWTGEVGFELLYWIPFLRRLRRRLGATPLHVVTRGGSGAWYGGIADTVSEAFDCVDADTFRSATDGETRKQRQLSPFDRRLLKAARARGGGSRSALVHPSLLYGLLYRYWKDQLPYRVVAESLEFQRLTPPAGIDLAHLPQPYTVARFYFSACFPDTPDNRAFATTAIRSLAERGTVVVLETPFRVDDHQDVTVQIPGVVRVGALMTPANNLAVQSAVIAGATGFVGTYGGFSYLAPFYGVPSVGCYSKPTFFPHHLDVARRAFDQLDVPGLTAVDVRQHALASAALGGRS